MNDFIEDVPRKNRMDSLIYVGYIILLLWSPLPFGSVEAWSRATLEVVAFLLLILFTLYITLNKSVKLNGNPLQLLLLATVGYAFIQQIPLFASNAGRSSISIAPFATYSATMVLIAQTILFILINNLLDQSRKERLFHILTFWGGAMAFFALLQNFAGNGKIYWFKEITSVNTFFGPYVNRNHFAGYMEMLVPIPITLLMFGLVRNQLSLIYSFISVLMALAIITSGSRGGVLCLLLETGFIFLSVLIFKNRWRYLRTSLISLVLIISSVILGIGIFGADSLVERLQEPMVKGETSGIKRLGIWETSWQIFRDHPVTGVGLGAFETAYPQYDKANGLYLIDYVHNDYLQLLTDLGIIGGIMGLLFFFLLFYRAFHNFYFHNQITLIDSNNISTQTLYQAQILAALVGCIGIAIHSVFDFNLQIPANALLFLTLAAIATYDKD